MIYICFYLIAFGLRVLSNQDAHQGIQYISIYSLFLLLTYAFKKLIKFKKKALILNFFLASLILIGTEPVLENDHYRYLWEGKVIAEGENPYFKNPSDPSLNKITFPQRDKIAYNKVASVYPPLGLGLYSLFSKFEYQNALILLQIFNLLLCCLLIHLISKLTELDFRILWIIPFLMKEYVQAVHIDLFAFIPFAYFMFTHNKWLKEILYWISIWIKWIPLVLFPFRFIKEAKEKNLKPFITVGFLSGFALLFVFLNIFELKPGIYNGPYAFSVFWKWNAGLYQLLQSTFALEHITIKLLCLITFAAAYTYYLWKGSFELRHAIVYLFSFLFFTAHVYNAWYGLWILLPALQMRNHYLLLYSFSAFVSYGLYDYPNYELLFSVLTHLWFILGLKELWTRAKLTRSNETI